MFSRGVWQTRYERKVEAIRAVRATRGDYNLLAPFPACNIVLGLKTVKSTRLPRAGSVSARETTAAIPIHDAALFKKL